MIVHMWKYTPWTTNNQQQPTATKKRMFDCLYNKNNINLMKYVCFHNFFFVVCCFYTRYIILY